MAEQCETQPVHTVWVMDEGSDWVNSTLQQEAETSIDVSPKLVLNIILLSLLAYGDPSLIYSNET